MRRLALFLAVLAAPFAAPLAAQTDPEAPAPSIGGPMTPEQLNAIATLIDPEAQIGPGAVLMTVDDVPVTIIYDASANRVRAMVPVASAENLTEAQMLRLLQANYDSALDARYAIAQGRVWSVFIHSLAELDQRSLVFGLAQTVALAQTYGVTYSSTDMLFGGGDSGARLRELAEPGEEL